MTDEPFAAELEEAQALISRLRHQLHEVDQAKQERRREYAREYYARNSEQLLEYQRQQRAKRREEDPERYRELARERTKRWRTKHKDEVNARQREKYHADPDRRRARRTEQYAQNAEEIRARRRAHYAANKDRVAAEQRTRREREKRRRDAGLPLTALHRSTGDERRASHAEAKTFFERPRSPQEMVEVRKEGATPPEELAAWIRDCARARAAYRLAEKREELVRLHKELAKAARTLPPKPPPAPTPQEIENARLDAVARGINERLRHREQPRRPHHLDPAAPHTMLQPNHAMGMNR